jgi:hypothetical protein
MHMTKRSRTTDRRKDGAHHGVCHCDLGQLGGDVPDMKHDAGRELSQHELDAGQLPVGYRLGQFDASVFP